MEAPCYLGVSYYLRSENVAEIKIDIKRSGFPITIGEVELWFNTSPESLRRYVEAIEGFSELEKNMQEKAKDIHLPDDFNVEDIENIDLEMTDKAFELNKEFIGSQYDLIFGVGTFDKLYSVYPDVEALENALNVVGPAINEKLNELEKERNTQVESIKNKYLNKKK